MMPPKTLCMLRLSSIGDTCHVVSVVQRIQAYWPDVKITWVIGKREHSLWQDLLDDVEFITVDKHMGLKGLFAFYHQMRHRQFDIFLHMQMAFRASVYSLGIRSDLRLGFSKAQAKELQGLFTNKKLVDTSGSHVLDTLHGFADALDIPKEKPVWQIKLPEDVQAWAEAIVPQGKTVIMVPSASDASRNWTLNGYIAVANRVMTVYGMHLILCGGGSASEIALGKAIQAQCHGVDNRIGQTSLKQLMALIAKAMLLIAPDTGPGHMATVVGTKVLSLFANTNPDRLRPYHSADMVVNRYPEAMLQTFHKPVTALRFGLRSRVEANMALITVADVFSKLDDFFSRMGAKF